MGQRRSRDEQFEQLVQEAEAEPHRDGDRLHLHVVVNGQEKYRGYERDEAKSIYLQHSGAMRAVVDAEWRRKPKYFSEGDDPEEGLAVKAARGSIELRADGLTLANLSVEGAEALQKVLEHAIEYARLS